MQYKNIVGGLILLSFSYGCGNASSDKINETKTDSTPAPVSSVVTIPADTSPVKQDVVINGQGLTTQPISPTAVTATKGALNPEHGKPGHRCDIAVGAPLNSKPTTPAATQPVSLTAPTTTITAPPAPATSTTVAPGMNPAHGQPGHRCDIAVGAPLNSTPKKN